MVTTVALVTKNKELVVSSENWLPLEEEIQGATKTVGSNIIINEERKFLIGLGGGFKFQEDYLRNGGFSEIIEHLNEKPQVLIELLKERCYDYSGEAFIAKAFLKSNKLGIWKIFKDNKGEYVEITNETLKSKTYDTLVASLSTDEGRRGVYSVYQLLTHHTFLSLEQTKVVAYLIIEKGARLTTPGIDEFYYSQEMCVLYPNGVIRRLSPLEVKEVAEQARELDEKVFSVVKNYQPQPREFPNYLRYDKDRELSFS